MFIDELESNIAFEEQRQADEEVWTKEYLEGYIAGLKQARDMFLENNNKN